MAKVQVTEKQIMTAIIHKLEAVQVEDGHESADVLGEKLPVTGIPGHQVTALFRAP